MSKMDGTVPVMILLLMVFLFGVLLGEIDSPEKYNNKLIEDGNYKCSTFNYGHIISCVKDDK